MNVIFTTSTTKTVYGPLLTLNSSCFHLFFLFRLVFFQVKISALHHSCLSFSGYLLSYLMSSTVLHRSLSNQACEMAKRFFFLSISIHSADVILLSDSLQHLLICDYVFPADFQDAPVIYCISKHSSYSDILKIMHLHGN